MRAFGFDIRLGRPDQLVSVDAYREQAMRNLPRMVRAYVDGGADGMATVNRNRAAFDEWALRTRVLRGNDRHDLTSEFAGARLSVPFLLAPTGFAGLSHWQGDVAAARAATAAGTRYVTSSLSSWSIEEIAEAAPEPQFFQLYPSREDTALELMERAWKAGNRALFVTADVPVKGNREGERRTGMGIPPMLTPEAACNMLLHLPWLYRLFRHRRIAGRNLVDGGWVTAAAESIEIQERKLALSTLNWDDFAWMRDNWPGELYLKGVTEVEDAARAVDHGAQGVVVSNHGGRQLDHQPASLELLPPIAAAIGDRATVLFDGGIRRGTDIVKALCLGADLVLIGRPYLYGLAAGGESGVRGVIEVLREELDRALTLMGVGDLAELSPEWLVDVRRRIPTNDLSTQPHP